MPEPAGSRYVEAGRWGAWWDDGCLRWITFDGIEVLRSIQITARDAGWASLRPVITRIRVDQQADGFSIGFHVRFQADAFDVEADVLIEGREGGVLDFRLIGTVLGETVAHRLGIVVLHPAALAGRSFEVGTDEGPVRRFFPREIASARVATGFRTFSWNAADDLHATLTFQPDPYETEDQRAWTDASYKSYSPPLDRPHPVTYEPGDALDLRVDLAVAGSDPQPGTRHASPTAESLAVTVSDQVVGPMPAIGLGWSAPPSPADLVMLRDLRPSHLRVILDRTDDRWPARLRAAAEDARAVDCDIELELVAFDDEPSLTALAL